jgi:hypothetical protein
MEYMYGLFDRTSQQTALNQTLYILESRPVGNCSKPPSTCHGDEPMFQAKMLANLANVTNNKTLFCDHVELVWTGLNSVYHSEAFRDSLAYSSTLQSGYGFTDSIDKSGHRLFESVLHYQVLRQLALLADAFGCGDSAGAFASTSSALHRL